MLAELSQKFGSSVTIVDYYGSVDTGEAPIEFYGGSFLLDNPDVCHRKL